MVAEHDSAGQALGSMRQLTAGYTPPEGACNTFRAFYFELDEMERDLHQHIHLENNILFPRAVALESRQSLS
jgi:regulator of cell morphogenesis and NO signaling